MADIASPCTHTIRETPVADVKAHAASPISVLKTKLRQRLKESTLVVGALRIVNSLFLRQESRGRWRTQLPKEVSFWKLWIESRGNDSERFRHALDPAQPLQSALAGLLDGTTGEDVRILDVGAGPISFVGKTYGGRPISLVPVDPLADEYKRLLDDAGVAPPFPTQLGSAEELSTQFPEGSFDLVHASNSIDHAFDPVLAIAEMVKMVRPGGYVWLSHFRNEGHQNGYYGLHQWNFDVEDGEFVVWNPVQRKSVTAALAGSAEIDARLEGDLVKVTLRRHG